MGLESPWYVERAEFDAKARRLDLYLDFRRGGRFTCVACGAGGCPAHDTAKKTWRHLDFFQQEEAYVHARVPRATVEACGVKRIEVPWARPAAASRLRRAERKEAPELTRTRYFRVWRTSLVHGGFWLDSKGRRTSINSPGP